MDTELYRKYSFLPEILYHICLFIFHGIVATLYKKFIFGGLQYKLGSINYGAFKFIYYGAGRKQDSIIESIVDIGKVREEDLSV